MDEKQEPSVPSVSPEKSQWIVGRVTTLLSHYFQPDQPADVGDMALKDWAVMLAPFSQKAIASACEGYLREQPRRRPTPGDIRNRAIAWAAKNSAKPDDRIALPISETPVISEDPEVLAARRAGANRILAELGFRKAVR